MTEHSLEQALSALMDGEASELELQRILGRLDEPEVRQTWQNLHLVRSAMHQEPVMAVDVSAGVREALNSIAMDETQPGDDASAPQVAGWKSWQRMAVAASVTLAVLGGVRFYNQVQLEPAEQVLAGTPAPATPLAAPAYVREQPVVLASYGGQQLQKEEQQSEINSNDWYREHLPLYLKQHARQSGIGGADSALPYARAASMEGR